MTTKRTAASILTPSTDTAQHHLAAYRAALDDEEQSRGESHLAERKKIRAAVELFDRDKRKILPREEVGTVMRYLGAYPSEEDLMNDILPALCDEDDGVANGSSSTAGSNGVKLERFEKFMVRVMVERMYEPDSEEIILQAFRVLDPEGRGYIDESTLHELLTENEWAFRDKEWEDFIRVAKDPDTNYIHYEDYVSMLAP